MTHHITDEQIAKAPASLADIQRKLVSAQSCHPKAVQTLIAEALDLIDDVARAGIGAAPAPAVPSGWSIADNSDGTITVQGPGMGCIVSDVEANERRVPGEVLHALCRAMLTAAPTPPAQDAEHAGLVSANGHLSTLLSESTQMLAQLRAMVDALHDEWSNGGRPERGEFSLLDRVDDWLNARPSEMLEPQHATPAQPAVPESADTTPPAQPSREPMTEDDMDVIMINLGAEMKGLRCWGWMDLVRAVEAHHGITARPKAARAAEKGGA